MCYNVAQDIVQHAVTVEVIRLSLCRSLVLAADWLVTTMSHHTSFVIIILLLNHKKIDGKMEVHNFTSKFLVFSHNIAHQLVNICHCHIIIVVRI